MSDDIRDRVIKALLLIRCELEEPCEECRILAVKDTDAVIPQLGLQLESFEDGYLTRYVTEWKTNDD